MVELKKLLNRKLASHDALFFALKMNRLLVGEEIIRLSGVAHQQVAGLLTMRWSFTRLSNQLNAYSILSSSTPSPD